MRRIFPYLGLMIFFLILAERITIEAILIGLLLAILVMKLQLNDDAEIQRTPLFTVRLWLDWLILGLVLIREIILANVQVAKIVLSKRMPISPQIYEYQTALTDERLIVLLSNAITLTPGTMTVEMVNQNLTIHALNEDYFNGLFGNPIEKILLRMEAKLNA